MTKLRCFALMHILMLTLAVPLVFAGGSREPAKVVIYTSIYEDVIEVLKEELNKQFPSYNIEFVYGGTGTLKARIAAEQASNRLGCDILLVAGPSYSLELKEKKMLHPYLSKEADNLAFDYDKEGYWYPVRVSNMVLAYNPERNAGNTIPDSFRGFADDARVRGAVSIGNPLVSGTTLAAITALKEKYGTEYFSALGNQNVTISYGTTVLQKLESGECKVAMVLEELILKKREEEGSKLEVIYPADGTIMIPSTIMIINNQWSANRNIAAAEAITDWFLGEQGQTAIVDGWMHSVRTNFPKLPFDALSTEEIRSNSMPVNWDFRQSEEILDSFEENVTNK